MPRPLTPLVIPDGAPLSPEQAFGLVLRERRLALDLTLEDLESHTQMSAANISRIERGLTQVGLRGIIHLAESVKMEPGDLLNEVVKRTRKRSA